MMSIPTNHTIGKNLHSAGPQASPGAQHGGRPARPGAGAVALVAFAQLSNDLPRR